MSARLHQGSFREKEKKNHILRWMERAWHTQSSNRPVGEYIVLGRIRVYYAVGNDSIGISYCGKDEFRAIIELCWKSITGQEMPGKCILECIGGAGCQYCKASDK